MLFHRIGEKPLVWGCRWIFNLFLFTFANGKLWYDLKYSGHCWWNSTGPKLYHQANRSCTECSRAVLPGVLRAPYSVSVQNMILFKGFHTHPIICTLEERWTSQKHSVTSLPTGKETKDRKATWYVSKWLVVRTELNPQLSILWNLIGSSYIRFLLISEYNCCLKVNGIK